MTPQPDLPEPAAPKAFMVPCARLNFAAPWRWLVLGWQDFQRAPVLSVLFGIAIMIVSAAVSALAWMLGRFALLAALLSGFVFIAPLIAVGLYCVSREHEAGRTPRLSQSFLLARRVLGQAGVFALMQLVILLVWSRAGMMVSAFFPVMRTIRICWCSFCWSARQLAPYLLRLPLHQPHSHCQ